jgi:hypothetical protein
MSQQNAQFDELPEALVEQLRQRDQPFVMLTPATDRAILAAAREQFAGAASRAPVRRRWTWPAAAAAAAVLVALIVARPFEQDRVELAVMADDIDGSGQVDVLDVFALARARSADPAAVSEARVEQLAERIVALNTPGAVL